MDIQNSVNQLIRIAMTVRQRQNANAQIARIREEFDSEDFPFVELDMVDSGLAMARLQVIRNLEFAGVDDNLAESKPSELQDIVFDFVDKKLEAWDVSAKRDEIINLASK